MSAVDPSDIFHTIEFSSRSAAVVAVSGGGDSVALLLLLKNYLDRHASEIRLIAATVDHGLRVESRSEAQSVASLCAQIGVEHQILLWSGEKPRTGLSSAAREARYRLLAQVAMQAGADMVLTGHTQDDQIETVRMRQVRGEGRGLAGMAPSTLYDGRVWIVRTLLQTSRSSLRDYLRARGAGWVDDPTNSDLAYERARIRSAVASSDATETLDLARATAMNRADLGLRGACLLRDNASCPSPGLVRLDPSFRGTQDRDAALYALRVLFAIIGGKDQLPDEGRVGVLFDAMKTAPFRATLSRTVIDARKSGIFLYREQRGLPASQALLNGMVWDGRYRLEGGTEAIASTVASVGLESARKAVFDSATAPESLKRAALVAEPVVCDADGIPLPLPHSRTAQTRIIEPWRLFMPSFDLPLVQAVCRLFDAPPPPPSPFVGHIEGSA